MATPKLTAAQKREREFMTLLEGYEQQWQFFNDTATTEIYTMAFQDGYDQAAYRYTRLTLWQRLTKRGL